MYWIRQEIRDLKEKLAKVGQGWVITEMSQTRVPFKFACIIFFTGGSCKQILITPGRSLLAVGQDSTSLGRDPLRSRLAKPTAVAPKKLRDVCARCAASGPNSFWQLGRM